MKAEGGGGMIGGAGGPGSPGKDYSQGGEGGPATGLRRLSHDDIMKILREEIVGDGQGYPHDGERSVAAARILAEIKRRYPVNNR